MKFLIILFFSTYVFSQEGALSERLKRCLVTNISSGLSVKIIDYITHEGNPTDVYHVQIKTSYGTFDGIAHLASKKFKIGDTISDIFFLEHAEKATLYDGFSDGLTRKVMPVRESELCKSSYLSLQEKIEMSDNHKSFPILAEPIMRQLVQMVNNRNR